MKNQLYTVISVLAIVAYFMPLLIVSFRKLWKATPFLLFALYWSVSGLVNLIDYIPVLGEKTIERISIVYNIFDMPMVLAIFYKTSSIRTIRRILRIALPVYLITCVINTILLGVNYDALKYILAIGLVMVLSVIIWEVIKHLQKVQHTSQEKGLLLVYGALLFQYGTYIIIYIFDYYLTAVSNVVDNFIIYYISTVVALIVAVLGYLIVGNPGTRKSHRNPNSHHPREMDSTLSAY